MKFENKDFVHLHVHSEYSQFDGLAKLPELVMKAREMGFPAMALTDHGTVGGWIKFIQKCKATKTKRDEPITSPVIKPILGCELYMAKDHNIKKGQEGARRGNKHLLLLAKDREGYKNLSTLNHLAWTEGLYSKDPRIDIDLLAKHSKGIVCSSACLKSIFNANLVKGRIKEAKEAFGVMKDIFKDDFFIEIMYHGIEKERIIIPQLLKISKEMNIDAICSNDVHYITKDQASSHELFMCMSTGDSIVNPNRAMKQTQSELYLKSAQEMGDIFGEYPQLLSNTLKIADRVDDKDIENYLFGGMRLPAFDIPEEFKSPQEYLEYLSWKGMDRRGWSHSQPHIEALKKELYDIQIVYENNGYDFATYFLIVHDYINHAKKNDIFVGTGRGSGYASVVLHCIGVCYGRDPLKSGLLWERFLGFTTKKFFKESDFGFADEKQIILDKDIDSEEEIEDEL